MGVFYGVRKRGLGGAIAVNLNVYVAVRVAAGLETGAESCVRARLDVPILPQFTPLGQDKTVENRA